MGDRHPGEAGRILTDGGAPWDDQYTVEPYDGNGSTRSMDIDIVDLSSDRWDGKGTAVFDGIVEGFQLLHDELRPVDGFRVRRFDVDGEFTGDNSWTDLDRALEQHGFDEPKHYHVIYDGRLLPSKIGSYHSTKTADDTMWHERDRRGISGLSLSTTRFTLSNAYTRGLHQSLHNYINDEIALDYADSDNGYDAVHELGTSTADVRTVMADTYPHRTLNGVCSDPDCLFFCRPSEGNLTFSECTITAIEESIRANQS